MDHQTGSPNHDQPADQPEEEEIVPAEQSGEEPVIEAKAAAEKPARAGRSAASLNCPKPLSEPIALIERLLAENRDLAEGVRMLCQRALVKPDALIEAASNYLAHAIDDKNLHLCLEIPAQYLAEELAYDDGAIIAPLVFSHWRASGDSARIVRLADALIDKAANLSTATAGKFLLEVAVELAVQKPLRSSRLIDIARPLIGQPEECAPLTSALRWRAVGDFLREDGASFRTFWQQRIRNPASAEWKNHEAKEALALLVGAQSKGREIPELILESIPPDTLPATGTVKRPTVEPAEAKQAEPANQAAQTPEPAPEPTPEKTAPLEVKPEKKPGLPFGLLVGGLCILALGAWIERDALLPLLKTSRPPSVSVAPSPSAPPPPAPPAAPALPAAEVVVVPVASPPPVAKAAEAPPAAAPPVASAPSPSSPEAEWRKARFAEVVKAYPALARWHEVARTSSWRDTHTMLMGLKTFLPYEGEEFAQLITLLLLDPPQDPQVREAVPKIAARRLKTGEFITLWEKLAYPGSPNEKEIRAAAEAFLSVKADYLTPETVAKLKKLAAPPADQGHE